MSTTIEGKVSVCAHNVIYSYEVEGIEITLGLQGALQREAEERAKTMINEGYVSGELNCIWQGEHEVRGWWQID